MNCSETSYCSNPNIIPNNNTKNTVNDEDILKKYYYFNKSRNKYFKKIRYCQFKHCFEFSNFKDHTNKNYCKKHSKNVI